jgi:ankyrin repeat protein
MFTRKVEPVGVLAVDALADGDRIDLRLKADPAAMACRRFSCVLSWYWRGLGDVRADRLLRQHQLQRRSLRRLLASGADIGARDGYGQTAVMLAAREGHAKVVDWLVDHGAALDHTAKSGLSALMLSVIGGRTDVVRILTAVGADLCLRGTGTPAFTAKSALDLAIARGDPDTVEILRTGGLVELERG